MTQEPPREGQEDERQEAPIVKPVRKNGVWRAFTIGIALVVVAGAAFAIGRATKHGASTLRTGSAPVQTIVKVFAPWTPGDTLSPAVKVTGHAFAGDCWTSSQADSSNPEAWRCISGNMISDPCFAPPEQSNVTQMACAESPWSGVVLLKLAHPLSYGSTGTSKNAGSPWFMQLANGDRCGHTTGTEPETSGVVLGYGCRLGEAGYPTADGAPWTVEYLAPKADVLQMEDVTVAWR